MRKLEAHSLVHFVSKWLYREKRFNLAHSSKFLDEVTLYDRDLKPPPPYVSGNLPAGAQAEEIT